MWDVYSCCGEALLEAAKRFVTLFRSLEIDRVCDGENEAVVVYDLDCPPPIGTFRAAAFFRFDGTLISSIELFYDPRPFV